MDRVEVITIIYNFLDMLDDKDVKFFEQPVRYYTRRGIQIFLFKAPAIARDINSHKYSKDQFIKFLFITALLKGRQGINTFQAKDVLKIRRITERFALKDEAIINKICQKYELPVDALMEIRDNGESILYKLLKTNHVSMAYALKNYKKVLTLAEKNAILFNTEYKYFHSLFTKFIQFIQGVSYAKV